MLFGNILSATIFSSINSSTFQIIYFRELKIEKNAYFLCIDTEKGLFFVFLHSVELNGNVDHSNEAVVSWLHLLFATLCPTCHFQSHLKCNITLSFKDFCIKGNIDVKTNFFLLLFSSVFRLLIYNQLKTQFCPSEKIFQNRPIIYVK